MRRFSFLAVLVALFFVLILPSCGKGTPKANVVASVKLPLSTLSLNKGDVSQLSPTAQDKNGTTVLADFTYSSDNTALISVSTTGAMCAGTWDAKFIVCSKTASSGSANVTVTAGGISTSVQVFVHETVDQVNIDPIGTDCISSTGTLQLTAHAYSKDAAACTRLGLGAPPCQIPESSLGNFFWGADDSTVVTFDNNTNIGKATAAVPGQTRIHANVSGNTSPAVTFTTCPVVSLSISTSSGSTAPFSLSKSGTQGLTATAVDSKNTTLTNVPVTWVSSQSFALAIASSTTTPQTATVTANNPGTSSFLATCTTPTCNIGMNPVYSNLMVGSLTGTSNETLYVASKDSLQVVPVDLAQNNSLGSAIALGQKPNSMVVDRSGTKVALGSDSTSAMTINTSTNVVSNVGAQGTMLGYSPDSNLLAFQEPTASIVEILSSSNGAALPYTGTNLRVGFSPDSHSVALVSRPVPQGNSSLVFWTLKQPVQTLTLNSVANDVDFLATGHAVYLAGGDNGQITARATCDPTAQVDSKAAANPQLVRAIPDGSGILVLDSPNIQVLSPISADNACPTVVNSTINSYTTGISNPTQLLVTPDSTSAFITDGSSTVYIFDIKGAHTVKPVTLSGVNATFQADLSLDSKYAYIGADDGKVHKIDLTAGSDVGQIDPALKQSDNTTRALPHFVGLRHKQ